MSQSRLPLISAALLAAALGVAGCASVFGETSRAANYSSNAKENYDKGKAELKNENYLDAVKYFQYTRAKFGFSKWATLAELGIADANLGREKYQEAVDGYKGFIKSHPTHEMVQNGYAAYKIGEAFYKQIPSEWFLVPPAYEKDQGPVRDALRELSAFVEEYSDSEYVVDARKKLIDCSRRLADHELYVAEFYLNRRKPLAAVGRLEGLLREYPHSLLEPEVLLLLGRTYMAMDNPALARKTFQRLMVAHPADFHSKKARLYIEHIDQRYGQRALAGAESPPHPATPAPPPMNAEPAPSP